jgi:serine/threonine-protein kinase
MKEYTIKISWYEELTLTNKQKLFLKKLLGLEPVYESISEIEIDFIGSYNV